MIYHITSINPEPWVAPEASIGRKGGKMFIQFYTSDTMRAYKEAIKEEVLLQNGHAVLAAKGVPLDVTFYLWRRLDASESSSRSSRRHVADATNCQKALEDALQGILYDNDRDNLSVHTVMVAQGPDVQPHIAIEIREFSLESLDIPEIPTYPSTQRGGNTRNTDTGDLF